MNNAPLRSETETKRQTGFLAILQWLASLVLLTEEEQDAAGIYFGDPYDHNDGTS